MAGAGTSATPKAAAKNHILSPVPGIWQSAREEIKEGEAKDGVLLQPDEIKKVAKWMQQTVTKFGASAAVADGPADKALTSFGEEVLNAFKAAVQSLICLSRGAGASLLSEVINNGSSLAVAMEELGAAVGTGGLSLAAGKVLDRVKHFERMSAHNRAAIRRRVLRSLAQISDAHRELMQVLQSTTGSVGLDPEDDLDDFAGSDMVELELGERQLVEALVSAVEVLLDVMKEASRLCVPGSTSPTNSSQPLDASGTASIEVLEAFTLHADSAAQAVDGLAVHAVGGLDAAAFKVSLTELRTAAQGFSGWPMPTDQLSPALDRVQAALEAVPDD